jgi:hypothetical protein
VSSPNSKLAAAEPPSDQEPPARIRSKHIVGDFSFSGVAGTAALFLGAIYAYGAVVKAGELHGAGLPVGNTLTLIPLEQILVVGIDKVIPIAVAVLIIVLLAMAFLDGGPATENETDPAEEKAHNRIKFGLRILTFASWVFIAIAASWTLLLVIVEGTVIGWYASTEHSTRRTYAIFSTSAVVVAFAALAWFDPSPLPEAQLTKRNGEVVKGDLIATTGSTWYVGTGDKEWVAVQARELEDSVVKGVHKKQNESLYHAITGHRLYGLGPE